MATFVLIPGADGHAWFWHRLVPELRARGHETVAVEMPTGPSAGLAEHAEAVVDAIGDDAVNDGTEVVVVAQSIAGFVGPLVCEQVPVDLLVLLNAMVPAPGETADAWWADTGQAEARAEAAARAGRDPKAEFDLLTEFFHDVPPSVTEEAMAAGPSSSSDTFFADPWPLDEWPDVPTRFLQGRDDRFFPIEFQRRVVEERLGVPVEELPGGHLLALSQPVALAEKLDAAVRELAR